MTSWWHRLRRLARALVRRDALERELAAEVQLHVALETEERMRVRGVDQVEARRQALVAFGGIARFTEEHRDARGVRWLEETVQDARYAARSLRRSLTFTTSSVLVLALGIGSTTAVFSAVNTVLFDARYERLVVIVQQLSPTSVGTLSAVDFRAIEEQQRSFSAVGAVRWGEAGVSAGGEPERVRIGTATSGFFRALGVRPRHGRSIEPADEVVGAPRVALVSQASAVRRLGSDTSAVGRSVNVDGIAHTVIGVLPAGVHELAGVRAEVWPVLQLAHPTRRGPFGMRVIGRLRDEATMAGATRDLATVTDRIFETWDPASRGGTVRLTPVPMRAEVLGNAKTMLALFAGAVGLVLLIAVANVASLMLVRAVGRMREIHLRAVLGASRARLVRLIVTESVLLSLIGAVAGFVLGALGLRALIELGPRLPNLSSAQLDLRAVCFASAVALLAGVIVGAYPVALLLRRQAAGALQGGDRTIGAGRATHGARSVFVVAQFALALPLLAIAGLLLNSFVRMQRVDPGFDPSRLLTIRVSLPAGQYPADSDVARYWSRAIPTLADVPGVVTVGLGSSMPPDDHGSSLNNFDLIDHPVAPGTAQPMSPWPTVNAAYFGALALPLLDGRLFTPADTGASAPVVVVSRSWARRFYPEGNAVGRTLISGGCVECPRTTVIGVVGDARYDGLDGATDAVYSPLSEGAPRDLNIFVRTTTSPLEVGGRLRIALRAVDPSVPLDDMATMDDRLYASIAQPRHWTTLLGSFAAAALVLAAVGIFGMLSYTVSSRRREIGVRVALGARRHAVVGLVVRRGMAHALIGIACGLGAALVGTRWMSASLFGVSATDPVTLAAVSALLLGAAFVACWLPARRAAAIDPLEAMRAE